MIMLCMHAHKHVHTPVECIHMTFFITSFNLYVDQQMAMQLNSSLIIFKLTATFYIAIVSYVFITVTCDRCDYGGFPFGSVYACVFH